MKKTADKCRHELTASWCALCNPSTGNLSTSIFTWERKHSDVDPSVLAHDFVANLSNDDARALCVKFIEERFLGLRRGRVRAVEERAVESRRKTEESTRRAEDAAARRERNEYAERHHVDSPWDARSGTTVYNRWKNLSEDEQLRIRVEKDEKFARFVAEEMREASATGRKPYMDGFIGWQMKDAMRQFHEATRCEVILELSSELLQSGFALGDGTKVTWGEASAVQHQQRFELLMGQSSGGLRAAQRHQAAVKLMQLRNVSSLNEAAELADAA